MLVDGSRFKELYDAVNQEKHQSEDKSIMVFVAHSNVDAICASRQLQDILQTDESPFSQNPVGSYEEIRQACEGIRDTQDLRTIICINCGATSNVRRICDIEGNDNIRVIIIDSHRPIWHGYNDGNSNTLVLLDKDDPVPEGDIPVYEDHDDLLRAGEDLYLRHMAAAEAGEEDEEEEEEASPSAPKRRRTTLDAEKRQRREELLAYYSEKTGFGKPSSLLLYDLAHKLHLEQTLTIWLAILGLTDQLVHQRISRQKYLDWKRGIEAHLHQKQGLVDPSDTSQRHDTLTIVRTQDLRLTLCRHWSLFDSLLFTPYTAARLHTWSDKGVEHVKLLLARMDIPLPQSKANYPSMSVKYRQALPKLLQQFGGEFGLNVASLMVEGFELRFKNDVKFTATDMVMMITMLLGRPTTDSTEAKMGFHEASRLLDVEKNIEMVNTSVSRVQRICQSVVQQGGQAIARKQVQGTIRGSKFWFLDISNLDFTHKEEFQHPAPLLHLTMFLRDAMCRRHNLSKAMVVVGPPDKDDHCYVVALRAKEAQGVMQNNPFARPFEEVVGALGISVKHSSFDSTLYLVRKADAAPFLEELKLVVARYEQEAHMAQVAAA